MTKANKYRVTIPVSYSYAVVIDNMDKTDVDRFFTIMPKIRIDGRDEVENPVQFRFECINDEPAVDVVVEQESINAESNG